VGRTRYLRFKQQLAEQLLQEVERLTDQKIALEPDKVVQLCRSSLEPYPYLASAYVAMGKALRAKGDHEQFDRVVCEARDKGLALLARGDHDGAADFFSRTAEVFPVQPEQLLAQRRLEELIRLVEPKIAQEPDEVIRFCWAAIGNEEYLASGYCAIGKALRAKGDLEGLDRLAATVRDKGLTLIERGELGRGAAFLDRVAVQFPETCRGFALLYGRINDLTMAHRTQGSRSADRKPGRQRLIVAIPVWGDTYVRLFTRYFIPSILSANNLPALSQIRQISFDVYTPDRFVEAIENSASYRELRRYAEVNFVTFAGEILSDPAYARHPGFKHRMSGGFHHVSIEHARAVGADLVCISPDSIHSDGALTNYIRFIDRGYKAVLFTAMRGQAETLLPILDALRDDKTQIMTLPARKLVTLNAAYVHHDFKRYVMTKGNRGIPPGLSQMFFPNAHGFYIRCFHIFPVALAADAIRRDVAFDYFTLDSNFLSRLFPDAESWKQLKIVQDSDDGVMLDLAYSYAEEKYEEREFTREQLLRQLPGYRTNHFWHFTHRIVYRTDRPIDAIGTFNRRLDGSLERVSLPVSSAIDLSDEELAAWFEAQRPKDVL
jgi:tetratricopeptide (TPR) repeat protein